MRVKSPFQPRKARDWPRLSETLTGPRHPERCQSCGAEHSLTDGIASHRWREHDDLDRPEPIVVVLCRDCSARLIEPHPRLYSRLPENEPCTGCMDICVDCRFRDGVRCLHPRAFANGGPGLPITVARPHDAHVCYAGGPKGGRRGAWLKVWPSAPTACAGKEPGDQAALATGGTTAERPGWRREGAV